MIAISNAPLRVILKIEVLPRTGEQITDLCRRLGMSQVATTSRLVEWFCEQQDVVQAAVLGLHPEDIRAELPAMILTHMAVGKKKCGL